MATAALAAEVLGWAKVQVREKKVDDIERSSISREIDILWSSESVLSNFVLNQVHSMQDGVCAEQSAEHKWKEMAMLYNG